MVMSIFRVWILGRRSDHKLAAIMTSGSAELGFAIWQNISSKEVVSAVLVVLSL
jgi:hypothetical protein